MQLCVDDLPPELWQQVIQRLPQPDQCTCRLVSHAFHELATSLVFAKVTVKFGDWDVSEHDQHGPLDTDQLERVIAGEAESFEVLESIVRNEWMAGMVRHLEVQAFEVYDAVSDLGEYPHTVVSPLCVTLVDRWTHHRPSLTSTTAFVHLARRSPSSLS